MRKAVQSHIASCITCQRIKRVRSLHLAGPLRHVAPISPFRRIQVDLAGPLPISESETASIVVMIDVFTRWIEVAHISAPTSEAIIAVLGEHILYRFGPPDVFQSDNASNLSSASIRAWAASNGIT
jgi:transposase InsO family protein